MQWLIKGRGPILPLIVRANWGPKGSKNFFENGPPLISGSGWPAPPPIWRSGSVTDMDESVDENLFCDPSNESYWVVPSCGTLYKGVSNFWVCGWIIIKVWLLKVTEQYFHVKLLFTLLNKTVFAFCVVYHSDQIWRFYVCSFTMYYISSFLTLLWILPLGYRDWNHRLCQTS